MDSITNFFSSANSIMLFLDLILLIVILILIFHIIWRVEKQLDSFFKLLGSGFLVSGFVILLRLLATLGMGIVAWLPWLEVLTLILFIAALSVMSKAISKLDNEKNK